LGDRRLMATTEATAMTMLPTTPRIIQSLLRLGFRADICYEPISNIISRIRSLHSRYLRKRLSGTGFLDSSFFEKIPSLGTKMRARDDVVTIILAIGRSR